MSRRGLETRIHSELAEGGPRAGGSEATEPGPGGGGWGRQKVLGKKRECQGDIAGKRERP